MSRPKRDIGEEGGEDEGGEGRGKEGGVVEGVAGSVIAVKAVTGLTDRGK